jgi:pantothenate synthetase
VAETAPEPQQQSESENQDDGNNDSQSDGVAKSSSNKNSKQAKQDKKKAKQKIATKIVTQIIQRMDNSAASQATQLALMNAIGANYKDKVNLTDNPTWYQPTTIYNQSQLIDPAASLFSGAQDQLMDRLIVSQY